MAETKTLNPGPGALLHDVVQEAVAEAANGVAVQFAFNSDIIQVEPGESFESVKTRLGLSLKSREEMADEARERLETRRRESEEAIAAAGAQTEEELRKARVPWLKTEEELIEYIRSVTDRPHEYGTCVYAMSMAATAALQYVASKVGASGFQASCADMDILRRTRNLEWGRILDYSNLLYPQYCDAEHFPGYYDLMCDPEIRDRLKEMAAEKLADSNGVHPNVKAHWEFLAAWATP